MGLIWSSLLDSVGKLSSKSLVKQLPFSWYSLNLSPSFGGPELVLNANRTAICSTTNSKMSRLPYPHNSPTIVLQDKRYYVHFTDKETEFERSYDAFKT